MTLTSATLTSAPISFHGTLWWLVSTFTQAPFRTRRINSRPTERRTTIPRVRVVVLVQGTRNVER